MTETALAVGVVATCLLVTTVHMLITLARRLLVRVGYWCGAKNDNDAQNTGFLVIISILAFPTVSLVLGFSVLDAVERMG